MLNKKLTTAITTFSTIAALVVAPSMAFADTSVGALGNGAESTNQVNVSQTNTNSAVQTNTADVTNNVKSSADSGGNHSDFTTGGSTLIESGPATNNTQVVNDLNRNVLQQQSPCNCANGNTQVLLGGNGALSSNNANVSSANDTSMFQTNTGSVSNNVDSKANSGYNTSDYGTNGNSTIISGPAKNGTGIFNALNQNVAVSGLGNGSTGVGGGTDVQAIGNGALSNNSVGVTSSNSNLTEQTNSAYVMNDVKSSADSGKNSADFTTGGSTLINSGPAWNMTGVSTSANSNFLAAGSDCGCGNNTFLKSGLNGALSNNSITAALSNDNSQFQTNSADVSNNFQANAKSGANSSDYSTSTPFGFSDPAIIAGGAYSNTSVQTQTNDNEIGGVSLGGWDFNFTMSNPLGWMAQ